MNTSRVFLAIVLVANVTAAPMAQAATTPSTQTVAMQNAIKRAQTRAAARKAKLLNLKTKTSSSSTSSSSSAAKKTSVQSSSSSSSSSSTAAKSQSSSAASQQTLSSSSSSSMSPVTEKLFTSFRNEFGFTGDRLWDLNGDQNVDQADLGIFNAAFTESHCGNLSDDQLAIIENKMFVSFRNEFGFTGQKMWDLNNDQNVDQADFGMMRSQVYDKLADCMSTATGDPVKMKLFVSFRNQFGTSGNGLAWDLTSDNKVDLSDFGMFKQIFSCGQLTDAQIHTLEDKMHLSMRNEFGFSGQGLVWDIDHNGVGDGTVSQLDVAQYNTSVYDNLESCLDVQN